MVRGLGGCLTCSWLGGQKVRVLAVLVAYVAGLGDLDGISTWSSAEEKWMHSLGETIGTSGVGAEKWESCETWNEPVLVVRARSGCGRGMPLRRLGL